MTDPATPTRRLPLRDRARVAAAAKAAWPAVRASYIALWPHLETRLPVEVSVYRPAAGDTNYAHCHERRDGPDQIALSAHLDPDLTRLVLIHEAAHSAAWSAGDDDEACGHHGHAFAAIAVHYAEAHPELPWPDRIRPANWPYAPLPTRRTMPRHLREGLT